MLQLPPLSLYIHIPWCIRKCPYCDFNSHEKQGTLPEDDYLKGLLANLRQQQEWRQGRTLQTLFIGGGTPSLLSAAFYDALLQGIAAVVPFANDAEITLEANPGAAEKSRFAAYRAAGINRLSIGVQSFHDPHLKTLGRVHDAAEAHAAIQAAQQAGFDRINIDLMYGLPQQTLAQGMNDLETALAFGVSHVSWYQLTVEPNTVFFRQRPVLPEDDLIADLQTAGSEYLTSNGFENYEISAWGKAGQFSRHNLNYWRFGDYLAIGAGAHGKITLPGENALYRFQQTRLPAHFLRQSFTDALRLQPIPPEERPVEFMMNALRLKAPVLFRDFSAATGLSPAVLQKPLEKLSGKNLLTTTDSGFELTATGRLFLNDVLEAFMPEPSA